MRTFFVTAVLAGLFVFPAASQKKQAVLATVGTHRILTDEFRIVYERSNGNIAEQSEKKSPEEYLELYIDFKLKVLEAEAQGFDTTRAFLEELAGYRAELAAPYLTDISFTEKLVEDTYERMKKEIDASHILISLPSDAGPEDTLTAYRKILDIRSEILNGTEFHDAALKYSQDPSAVQNRGRLGWFTAFQMVVPFEDAAYSTPQGTISQPVRSKFGYHLIKVNGIREVTGEIKVAHIMKMFPQNVSPEIRESLRNTIDSLYNLLQQGADFAELARNYSDDQRSAAQGGEMPYFGRSRMIPAFSDPAFELARNGDFTKPVETTFGFHIIKRIDLKPVPPFSEIDRNLKESIRRDPDRTTQSRDLFLNRLRMEYNYKRNKEAVDELLQESLSYLAGTKDNSSGDFGMKSRVLFTLNGENITAESWFEEIKNMPADTDVENLRNYYELWESDMIIQYEDSRLEEKYPEFRSLYQEYHDGLLLFAISEEKIWQKAASDTLGLIQFYQTNKAKHMWGERYKGMIITCNSPELKDKVEMLLDSGIPAEELFDVTGIDNNSVTINEGIWSKGENAVVDYYIYNAEKPSGWNSETSLVRGELTGPEPKLLGDSRGFHISDYQQYLEDNWLRELRSKYEVKVHKKELKKIRHV
jgi:peptidyl-prolyl cis-trans isomerase SurA